MAKMAETNIGEIKITVFYVFRVRVYYVHYFIK